MSGGLTLLDALPADSTGTGGRISGTPAALHPSALGREGRAVVFPVTVLRPVMRRLTLTWTADVPHRAIPDEDYHVEAVDRITLTSVLSYAHWSPRPGLGVWGVFGAGWGDLKFRDEAGKVETDLEMLMAADRCSGEGGCVPDGIGGWGGADDRLPKTAGDAQRLRLMLEGRTAWAVSKESQVTPVFEIGGRWDGGKTETGVGAELGRGGRVRAHETRLGHRSPRAVLIGASEIGIRRMGGEPDAEAGSGRGEAWLVVSAGAGVGGGSESDGTDVGQRGGTADGRRLRHEAGPCRRRRWGSTVATGW